MTTGPGVGVRTTTEIGVPDAVDAHHHIWRQADLAWLNGRMQPRIFGPYEPIRRDYLARDYVADVAPLGFSRSVYVQANWPLERSLDEVRWVHEQHEETGWPSAIVGSGDLFDNEAGELFAAQQKASPLMRGARLQLHWHENPTYRFASAPDRMHDPVLHRNLQLLADLGWVFELQVFAGQMPDAARMVAELPDVTFVLAHAGMPQSLEPDHLAAWRTALAELAVLPNVVVKLSAQGTFVHRVDPELIGVVTMTCLDLFGSRRCLFGTNLPIERIWTDAGTLVGAWLGVLGEQPLEVRRDVLSDTARRVYRLD